MITNLDHECKKRGISMGALTKLIRCPNISEIDDAFTEIKDAGIDFVLVLLKDRGGRRRPKTATDETFSLCALYLFKFCVDIVKQKEDEYKIMTQCVSLQTMHNAKDDVVMNIVHEINKKLICAFVSLLFHISIRD